MAAPKLRFKAFIKPYKNIKYEEFAPLQRGFDLPVSTIVDGEYPVVFSNGILKKHNSFKAKAPGVVTGRSGTIGNITWVDKDYWPHNTSLWVTNFFDNDPRYTFYFLQDFDVSRFASGSGVPTLNRNDVHAQLIHIPTDRNEQSKIATFLSAVDEKITQLTQKHQLLSQYKQGMMQKLFSQQIRFKADDGSQFEEWVTKTIKELNLYISDGNYGELYPTSAQFVSHGVPFIRANNIKNLKVTNNDMRFIDENLHQILNSGHLKTNDIIVTTRGDIGMVALVDSSHEGSNINAQICLLRVVDQSQLSPQFLLYFLDSSFGQKQFKELQTGTALKQLPKKSLDKIITLVPSINEQTKIANFLSAIDQKIDVVSEQLEQAKLWKKGLLQQMFV